MPTEITFNLLKQLSTKELSQLRASSVRLNEQVKEFIDHSIEVTRHPSKEQLFLFLSEGFRRKDATMIERVARRYSVMKTYPAVVEKLVSQIPDVDSWKEVIVAYGWNNEPISVEDVLSIPEIVQELNDAADDENLDAVIRMIKKAIASGSFTLWLWALHQSELQANVGQIIIETVHSIHSMSKTEYERIEYVLHTYPKELIDMATEILARIYKSGHFVVKSWSCTLIDQFNERIPNFVDLVNWYHDPRFTYALGF